MPDHAPRPTHEPPWILDRVRANILSTRDAVLSIIGGGLVGVDALVPDGRWLASYSLAAIPHILQVIIAGFLVAGGAVTLIGVLVRQIGGRKIPPLTTIMTEKLGWLLLAFGWGVTAATVYGNGRLGSTLSLVIVACLSIGSVAKCALLWWLESQVRAEVRAQERTTAALRTLKGDTE